MRARNGLDNRPDDQFERRLVTNLFRDLKTVSYRPEGCLALHRACGISVDIPVDDFWQISGIFGGNRGDIHRLRGREEIAKALVVQGFPSLFVLVILCLRSLPKLDVAGSTPVAPPPFLLVKSATCDDSATSGTGARSALDRHFKTKFRPFEGNLAESW